MARLVKKQLPQNNFFKFDLNVLHHDFISLEAKIVYCFIASARINMDVKESYLMSCTGLSRASISRIKKELKKAGLITIIREGKYDYILKTSLPSKDTRRKYADLS